MISFFSSVMTNNKNIRLGIISGIKKLYDADLIPYHREQFRTSIMYFNLMGGVRILEILSFEEVEEITIELLKEKIVSLTKISKFFKKHNKYPLKWNHFRGYSINLIIY